MRRTRGQAAKATTLLVALAAACVSNPASPAADGAGESPVPSGADAPESPQDPAPDRQLVAECDFASPEWIWCDDFDQDRTDSYFEFNRAAGKFDRIAGVGVEGSSGMRTRFDSGTEGAGWLHVAFGRTPQPYFRPVDAGTADHREIYWRVFVRNEAGWVGGGGYKLSRATSFVSTSSWQRSFAAHLWSGSNDAGRNVLLIDPASGTDEAGNLRPIDAGWRWLGLERGTMPLFDEDHVGEWYCVETHLRLNDPGKSDGVFEFWIDGRLEASRTGLNLVGAFNDYGINAVYLENYWNGGAPQAQERYFDNFVVSSAPIGCR